MIKKITKEQVELLPNFKYWKIDKNRQKIAVYSEKEIEKDRESSKVAASLNRLENRTLNKEKLLKVIKVCYTKGYINSNRYNFYNDNLIENNK